MVGTKNQSYKIVLFISRFASRSVNRDIFYFSPNVTQPFNVFGIYITNIDV